MAYTKQNWECGDLITADKMNHIEDGIEDASSGGSTEPLSIGVNFTEDEDSGNIYTLDKTWQQIFDAYPNVYMNTGNTHGAVCSVENDSEGYMVTAYVPYGDEPIILFGTDTTNGYPRYVMGK